MILVYMLAVVLIILVLFKYLVLPRLRLSQAARQDISEYVSALIISVFLLTIILLLACELINENAVYNNGICAECGGSYVLTAVHRDTYYYVCDTCHNGIHTTCIGGY